MYLKEYVMIPTLFFFKVFEFMIGSNYICCRNGSKSLDSLDSHRTYLSSFLFNLNSFELWFFHGVCLVWTVCCFSLVLQNSSVSLSYFIVRLSSLGVIVQKIFWQQSRSWPILVLDTPHLKNYLLGKRTSFLVLRISQFNCQVSRAEFFLNLVSGKLLTAASSFWTV